MHRIIGARPTIAMASEEVKPYFSGRAAKKKKGAPIGSAFCGFRP